MALHDWSKQAGWESVHIYWMTELARDLRANLPPGYRAFIGTTPLAITPTRSGKPDVSVAKRVPKPVPPDYEERPIPEPDFAVELATLEEEELSLMVVEEAQIVAVIELISPRNKDRPSERRSCGHRYADYLRNGVNLLIVDVHRRPALFSFPQYVAKSFGMTQPMLVAPSAVSFGLGGGAPSGGRMVDVWQRPLVVGQPLPAMTLMLTGIEYVTVNLDETYSRAAADSYLE